MKEGTDTGDLGPVGIPLQHMRPFPVVEVGAYLSSSKFIMAEAAGSNSGRHSMPEILEAVALNAGNRRLCILFLDEWPRGPSKGRLRAVDGEVFELDIVHLDGDSKIHDEPRVGIELTGRDIDAAWFEGKELQAL